MSFNAQDESLLRRSLTLATEARSKGDEPFGAVLASEGGQILYEAVNTVNIDIDITGHAEMNLIRRASKTLGMGAFKLSTMYASTEPCAMCAAAACWAGVGRIVYGCPAAELDRMAGAFMGCQSRDVISACVSPPTLIGPCLLEESLNVHAGYWEQWKLKRASSPPSDSIHPLY